MRNGEEDVKLFCEKTAAQVTQDEISLFRNQYAHGAVRLRLVRRLIFARAAEGTDEMQSSTYTVTTINHLSDEAAVK